MIKKVDIEQKEIEAPYDLPEGWKWVRLGEVCSIPITDGTHKTPEYTDSEHGIPFVSSKDVTKGFIDWSEIKYITKDLHAELYARLAPQINDILLAKNGTTGIAAIVDCDKVFDIYVTLALLRPDTNKILPLYLLNIINSPICKKQFDEHLTGIGVPNLHLRDIKVIQIPLPPTLAEQQRIVNRIESMFAKLDEAKEKARNAADSFETRKAAILHQAFTGSLTAKWRKENGIRDESWEEKTIGEICLVKGGKRVPKGMSLIKERNAHPYLKAGNLKEGTVIDKDMEFVPDDILQIIKNYTVKAGDIYITNVGACIGDCGIIPSKYDGANLTENAVKLTDFACSNDYLAQQLASNMVQHQIKSKIKSATLGKLSIDNIKSLKINLPSLPEQQEIVRILDTVLEKERAAKSAAEQVLEQISLLKKSILARAFRGEL